MAVRARTTSPQRAFLRALQEQHPALGAAVRADAEVTALHRGERHRFRSRADAAVQIARLCLVSDAFIAQMLYRIKASLQRRGVPILPRVPHRLAMLLAQITIGDPVILRPGVYVLHGQIVIDGLVVVGSGTVIAPWVTIGLRAGNVQGPTIGTNVEIGTGAKIIGPVTIGAGAKIGANAVVVNDVAEGATVVGAPARSV